MSAASESISSDRPRVSFVIPARDEERTLPLTLESVQASIAAVGVAAEVIVVNDGSTDRTAEIAKQAGARVLDVELHNIGAVRNAGAEQARGDVLIFLDADTQLPAQTLRAALEEIDNGAVGGGSDARFDQISWFQNILTRMFTFVWLRVGRWAAGCFIYCRREDFTAVGGFNEEYFAAEERYLSEALRRRGKFVILREHVVTSARKLRLYSTASLFGLALRVFLWNPGQLKRREGLEVLYDAPREQT